MAKQTVKLGDGVIQATPDSYFDLSHDTKGRFCSYWHQIISSCNTRRVLEIGVGNGFTSRYLNERGFEISTLDIDPELHPTHVGSVTDMPLESESFPCVACFEVLEHLPFEHFATGLSEIHRVTSEAAVISLPDASRSYCLFAGLPRGIKIKRLLPYVALGIGSIVVQLRWSHCLERRNGKWLGLLCFQVAGAD
jgi:hypothetical protein